MSTKTQCCWVHWDSSQELACSCFFCVTLPHHWDAACYDFLALKFRASVVLTSEYQNELPYVVRTVRRTVRNKSLSLKPADPSVEHGVTTWDAWLPEARVILQRSREELGSWEDGRIFGVCAVGYVVFIIPNIPYCADSYKSPSKWRSGAVQSSVAVVTRGEATQTTSLHYATSSQLSR